MTSIDSTAAPVELPTVRSSSYERHLWMVFPLMAVGVAAADPAGSQALGGTWWARERQRKAPLKDWLEPAPGYAGGVWQR